MSGLYFMIGIISPSFGSSTEARKIHGQALLNMTKNNKLVVASMTLGKSSQVLMTQDQLKDLKVYLLVDSLKSSDEKFMELLKSSALFDSKNHKFIEVSSVESLKLGPKKGEEQIFSGSFVLKVKNKSQKIRGDIILKKSPSDCSLSFTIDVPDRTKNLGLKYNSKKYSSEVELGENIIDDKLSFSIQAKCN